MNRVYTRHVGLGIAGALVTSTRDAVRLGLWAAKASSRIPLAAPLRGPARKLIGDVEHRGALNEARLLADAGHLSAEWFARAAQGPLLDHVASSLAEAAALGQIRRTAARQNADACTAEPALDGDERLTRIHVTEPPAVEQVDNETPASDQLRPGEVWSGAGMTTVNDRMAGLARGRLHGQARAALLAGFEGGVAPA